MGLEHWHSLCPPALCDSTCPPGPHCLPCSFRHFTVSPAPLSLSSPQCLKIPTRHRSLGDGPPVHPSTHVPTACHPTEQSASPASLSDTECQVVVWVGLERVKSLLTVWVPVPRSPEVQLPPSSKEELLDKTQQPSWPSLLGV